MNGISVAGKTGTALKVQKNGTYTADDGSKSYFASFVGFFPASAPQVTILVSVDEPDPTSNAHFGGTGAAPIFVDIAQAAIHELQITPPAGDTGCHPRPEHDEDRRARRRGARSPRRRRRPARRRRSHGDGSVRVTVGRARLAPRPRRHAVLLPPRRARRRARLRPGRRRRRGDRAPRRPPAGPPRWPPCPRCVVADTRPAMGQLAAAFHGHPSRALTIVGVTGTNGKTTTTSLLAAILEHAGLADAATIGTLTGRAHHAGGARAAGAAGRRSSTPATRAVVMEVSSHALALPPGRRHATSPSPCSPTSAATTSTSTARSRRYFAAKAALFDARAGRRAASSTSTTRTAGCCSTRRRSRSMAFSLADVDDLARRPSTSLATAGAASASRSALGGRFNVANSLAAATTCAVLGRRRRGRSPPAWPRRAACRAGSSRSRAGQPFAVIVDYAHTPDGLRAVLAAARAGRRSPAGCIVVFGAAATGTAAKRPVMGAVAAALADRVVVTSDNPRSEDPLAIIGAIVAGVAPDYRGRARDRARPPPRPSPPRSPRPRPGDVVVDRRQGPRDHPDDRRRVPCRSTTARSPASCWSDHVVIAVMIAGAVGDGRLAARHPLPHLVLPQPRQGPADPRQGGPRPRAPHGTRRARRRWAASPSSCAALVGWVVAHVRRGLVFSNQALIMWVRHPRAGRAWASSTTSSRSARRHNRGIFWKKKSYITLALSIGIAWVLVVGHRASARPSRSPGPTCPAGTLPWSLCVVCAGLIIWATTNAVNVTDGLDGLAAGSALLGLPAPSRSSPTGRSATRRSTAAWSTRSTSPCSPPRSPARAAASCGGTPPRRGSSWATSARSASAPRWPCSALTTEHPAAARADLRRST